MPKLLRVLGSPRPNGNSTAIARRFGASAAACGVYHLGDIDSRPEVLQLAEQKARELCGA